MSAISSTRLALCASVVASLCACAGWTQPFSQIDGHKYFSTALDTYSVQIIRIDGRDTLDDPVFVDPGLRKVVVQGPPDGGAYRFGEQRTIELNVAPCRRYHLVAVKQTRLASDFVVKVDFEEPIAGCNLTPPK